MSEQIGMTAGKVWSFLKANGAASSTQIQKKIGADAATTNQALGWLAREGKLKIDRSQRVAQFELME